MTDDWKWAEVEADQQRRIDFDRKRGQGKQLAGLGLRDNPQSCCTHCGQPFDQFMSSGGQFGICQRCIDG